MLFMLTPEIKTNLILKEIGIKRYSLRSSNDQSQKKSLHFYKKGHILALLDKPYENFVREQQDLLEEDEKELKKTIAKFEKDELEHHDIGLKHDAKNAPAYDIMTKIIEIGCKTAIAISKKI